VIRQPNDACLSEASLTAVLLIPSSVPPKNALVRKRPGPVAPRKGLKELVTSAPLLQPVRPAQEVASCRNLVEQRHRAQRQYSASLARHREHPTRTTWKVALFFIYSTRPILSASATNQRDTDVSNRTGAQMASTLIRPQEAFAFAIDGLAR
jgi:hypothetical protein